MSSLHLSLSALLCALEGQQAPLSSSFCQLNGRHLHEMEGPGRARFQYFYPSLPAWLPQLCPFSGGQSAWQVALSLQSPCLSMLVIAPSPCPLGYRNSNSFLLSLALTYRSILRCPLFSSTEHTFVNGKISPKWPNLECHLFSSETLTGTSTSPSAMLLMMYRPEMHTQIQLTLAPKPEQPSDSITAAGWCRQRLEGGRCMSCYRAS